MMRCLLFLIFATLFLGQGMIGDAAGTPTPERIRIALLHLDARPGEVGRNRRSIENAIAQAVTEKADWVLTPELAETGYGFAARIGTGWTRTAPPEPSPRREKSALNLEPESGNPSHAMTLRCKEIWQLQSNRASPDRLFGCREDPFIFLRDFA